MFITDEELSKRLNHPETQIATNGIVKDERALPSGQVKARIPQETKVDIGVSAGMFGPIMTAQMFGVSQPMVNAIEKGQQHPLSAIDDNLKDEIDKKKMALSKRAIDALFDSLNIIDVKADSEAEDLKLKDKVEIAKGLSSIVKNLGEGMQVAGAQYIIVAPPVLSIDRFGPIVEVG